MSTDAAVVIMLMLSGWFTSIVFMADQHLITDVEAVSSDPVSFSTDPVTKNIFF